MKNKVDDYSLSPAIDHNKGCMSRRKFLLAGGAIVALNIISPTLGFSTNQKALKKGYKRMRIASISDLSLEVPIEFTYPDKQTRNFIIKLGKRAGAGVGKNSDIVAFNNMCTHMGGPLTGTYKKSHHAIGPCPLHLTTFDLTRYGIVVAGQATESLPQVNLEVDGNDIYAVGFQGLIYGRNSNL